MPTLAEIMAAKAAIRAAKTAIAKEEAEAKPAGGIRITPETEKAAKAAEIKGFLDASAPKVRPPAPRELGAMEAGEQIPMDHPAPEASEADWAWFSACRAFDSSLCVVIEPGETAAHAWIACQSNPHRAPILLHRLPLLNRPNGQNPF